MTDDIVERPATKDIRFHERLMRLSDCIASDPNIDEDLWAVPLAALAEIERLRAENKRLRAAGDALLVVARGIRDCTGQGAGTIRRTFEAWEEARYG